jgi:hypothetical protein
MLNNPSPQPTAHMARPWVKMYHEQDHCADDVAT